MYLVFFVVVGVKAPFRSATSVITQSNTHRGERIDARRCMTENHLDLEFEAKWPGKCVCGGWRAGSVKAFIKDTYTVSSTDKHTHTHTRKTKIHHRRPHKARTEEGRGKQFGEKISGSRRCTWKRKCLSSPQHTPTSAYSTV